MRLGERKSACNVALGCLADQQDIANTLAYLVFDREAVA
jgi:hypothetical protein